MTSPPWRPGRRCAIIGGGPGAISAALAFNEQGFDVRIYERQPTCEAIGGGVLLSVPVLAILRHYGIDPAKMGSQTVTYFKNKDGKERVKLRFNPEIERKMGIKGWHYGILRSTAFRHMLELLPEGVLITDHEFVFFVESDNAVDVHFKNGAVVTADIVVGADGIRSRVSRQLFGDPNLFHTGIRLYLAWCDAGSLPGVSPDHGVISHSSQHQASYFPMKYGDGKQGFEWWVVEPSWEGKPVPEDIRAHLADILSEFADPMPGFLPATDVDNQVYRWEIYNRPTLESWSRGRVVCVGDAVHPVSPYAAYGMGMAIEDGYHLAKSMEGIDLSDALAVQAGFEVYNEKRVRFVNHNMEFARMLGKVFHALPWPLRFIRDAVFDYTAFMPHFIGQGYLENSEKEALTLKELFTNP